jgi:hypothetical protein
VGSSNEKMPLEILFHQTKLINNWCESLEWLHFNTHQLPETLI